MVKKPSNLNILANCIRFLAIDSVQKANSGHPGMPMGMADIATVLFKHFLKFDPKNPDIHISGWGVLPLKSVHRWKAKHLKDIASDASTVSDRTAKSVAKELYDKHSPLMHKIMALNEAYKQINSPQYKRAVTMWSMHIVPHM